MEVGSHVHGPLKEYLTGLLNWMIHLSCDDVIFNLLDFEILVLVTLS